YLRTELETYNRESVERGRRWILIKPVGRKILLGPIFHPGRTGCWRCLAQRLRMNRAVQTFVQRKQDRREPFPLSFASTPATEQIPCGMAATEIARWIAGIPTPLADGKVLSLDIVSWESQLHTLVRQPECPVCSSAAPDAERPARPVELQSRKKTFVED